jgi:hypothetical protein
VTRFRLYRSNNRELTTYNVCYLPLHCSFLRELFFTALFFAFPIVALFTVSNEIAQDPAVLSQRNMTTELIICLLLNLCLMLTAQQIGRCPDTWFYFEKTNKCFRVFGGHTAEPTTWLLAERYCKRFSDGHLGSFHSVDEITFVIGAFTIQIITVTNYG